MYWAFDRKLDVANVEYDEQLELCWTLDFNIGRPCSLLCQIAGDRIVVLDEIAMRDLQTFDICEEFLRRFPNSEKVPRVREQLQIAKNL